MKFVLSMTDRIGTLKQIVSLWDKMGDERNPFAHMMFTPLFARTNARAFIENELRHRGEIYFDSGGYYVQQGVTTYEKLYQDLIAYYQANDWGQWYILPDYVPTSSLTPEEVEARVQATITVSRLFFHEMPTPLRSRALPVVQGHTQKQIQACVESYAQMGVHYVGFGSFGTSGNNHAINTITRQSIEMLQYLRQLTNQHEMKIHAFGIGTPAVLSLFYDLGVDSFDSSCWSRTAGFGNVYLPFTGRRNITQRMIMEVGGKAYQPAEFKALCNQTEHRCPFCEDFDALKRGRIYQMLHNLCVMLDMMDTFQDITVSPPPSRYHKYVRQQAYTSLDL